MSRYFVISNESNSLISIIEWDGVSPVFTGSLSGSYRLELETTSSNFISSSNNNLIFSSSNQEFDFDTSNNIFGNLDETVTINNKPLYYLSKNTDNGKLNFLNSNETFIETLDDNTLLQSGLFTFNSASNSIFLSFKNSDLSKNYNYSSSLSKVINNPTSSFLLKFYHEEDTSALEYLIVNSEVSSSISGSNYLKLTFSKKTELFEESFKLNNSVDYDLLNGSVWNVDFDFGNKLISADTIILNGENISNTLTFHNLSYGRLKWDASSYDVVGECTPKKYFRFDRDASGSIGEWNAASPQKISLSLSNIYDYLLDGVEYRKALFNIIQEKIEDVEIKLTNVDVVNSYKTFKILSGSIYGKQFRQNLSPLYFKMNWGNGWEFVQDEIDPEARYDELPSLDPGKEEHWYEYVELDVEQVETSVGMSSAPLNDDEFTIGIYFPGTSKNRKAIFEFTSSVTPWEVPKWADKVTIYAIGAGGGGGGGSTGWGHSGSTAYFHQKNTQNDDVVGFDFATGGGGGAGGNISISEFLVDKKNNATNITNIGKSIIPSSSKLNIFVGSGGSGGTGLSNNNNDYMLIYQDDIINYVMQSPNVNLSKIYWLYAVGIYVDSSRRSDPYRYFYKRWMNDSKNVSPSYTNSLRVQIPKETSLGKNGGNSFVLLDQSSNLISNKNIEMVKATGGRGGLSGLAVQTIYDFNHRHCAESEHYPLSPIVQGGASDIGDSFGNVETINGGHGGYGVSMPTLKQGGSGFEMINNKLQRFTKKYEVANEVKNKHIAPDIPWSKNENKLYLKTPIGSTYNLVTGETLETSGYKKYQDGGYIKPEKISPLGGNGGLGASYHTLFTINAHTVWSASGQDISGLYNTYYENETFGIVKTDLPTNWYTSASYRALNEITYGSSQRPKIKIDNTLISTFANFVNGYPFNSTYEFKLENSGSLGGLNLYELTDGTNAIDYTSIAVIDRVATEPEIGYDYGQGGGGGAASYITNWDNRNIYTKSQDGADGANGIVIVIVEEF